jgi:protein-S-isoprenylcysteine O-methyltransferase Ste14
LRFAPEYQLAAFYGGLAIIIAGSLLRRHCFKMLGISFTGDVQVRADQTIVTRGAYRILRHPSYTAGIILSIGMGIALGSWGSTCLLAVAAFATYIYRMSVEERALLNVLGEPYRQFISTRKRLIPYIY